MNATSARTPLLRLSVMMFLQYAVWGAWLPLAARYFTAAAEDGGLGFDGRQVGMILGLAGSIGAVSSPFIAGQLADRYFRAERFLAALLLIGAVVQWVVAGQTSYEAWLGLSIAYSVVYMPTIALSNSLAFAHIEDEQKEFPRVRLWGTIGWITASWVFPMIWLQTELGFGWMPPFLTGTEVPDATNRLVDSLRFSAMISAGYAVFCLFLPATPPKRDAVRRLAFGAAFQLMKRRSFAVLVGASLLVSVIHQIYFLQTAPFLSFLGLKDSQIGPAMTIGQFSEIAVMAALGWLLKSLGFRAILCVGASGYFLRYGIWSFTDLPVPVLVVSQALHGLCFACFFAAAFIYVDRIASADIRHSAQTVFGIIILGGGPVLGGRLSGALQERFTDAAGVVDWSSLWRVLSAIGLGVALYVWIAFRDQTATRRDAAQDDADAAFR